MQFDSRQVQTFFFLVSPAAGEPKWYHAAFRCLRRFFVPPPAAPQAPGSPQSLTSESLFHCGENLQGDTAGLFQNRKGAARCPQSLQAPGALGPPGPGARVARALRCLWCTPKPRVPCGFAPEISKHMRCLQVPARGLFEAPQ